MPPTSRGIYHNLKESKYTISNDEIVFFFSSKYYMHKFLTDHFDYREKMQKWKERIFEDVEINLDFIADMKAYKEIEKRGFRCMMKGIDITWNDLEKFALRQMTKPNTNDWHVIRAPKLKERIKSME